MARFLIEVEHEDHLSACIQAARILLTTGSHFLTNADWGCNDGIHKVWIIVDVENKDEARRILPVEFRNIAQIIQLNKFTFEDIDNLEKSDTVKKNGRLEKSIN